MFSTNEKWFTIFVNLLTINRHSFNIFLVLVVLFFRTINAKHRHYNKPAKICTNTTNTVISTPTPSPEDICCGSGRACYKDSMCDRYEFINSVDYYGKVANAVCNFYKESNCSLGWSIPSDSVEYGVVNCGFCRV
ncbi:16453_t:CDS:1 [Racocetra persica]|uniref:16453_t:CDS:1 n=1 Tax=Racocetra persica TaxID=160502 RepID=A0ACA9K821_9GLOM|nr:16453_t:CDS:1 [Racocetra persica]